MRQGANRTVIKMAEKIDSKYSWDENDLKMEYSKKGKTSFRHFQ